MGATGATEGSIIAAIIGVHTPRAGRPRIRACVVLENDTGCR
jgi:hypothetical protein